MVCFRTGEGRFALPVESTLSVRTIEGLVDLPSPRADIVGLLPGDPPLSVLASLGSGGDHVLVVISDDVRFGLHVLEVLGVRRFEDDKIGPPPKGQHGRADRRDALRIGRADTRRRHPSTGGSAVNQAAGRILVAEDSLVVRAVVCDQLEEEGYEVVQAVDGESALAAVRARKPDAILLDIEMPGLDGHQVLARLKADPELSDIPVVFLTGRTSTDDMVAGLRAGAHDY